MRRKFSAYILMLLLIIISPVYSGDSLKIITYNIQGMKPGTNPQTRLLHIIEKLIIIDPDIIGLQEINESLTGGGIDNQARIIADSLTAHFGISYNHYISFTHLSWNNQFREFIGIISKYPVVQQGSHQLIQGVFPRKVVWNYINTPLGMINFFNTHLSFNSGSVRVQQVQQTIFFINQQESIYPAVGSILTGDFNDTPGSQAILLLTSSGTDTFYLDTYFEVNPNLPGYTVPSNAPASRIDYIFYKNNGQLNIDTSFVIMDQPYSGNNYCSDHLGVLTTFSLNISALEYGEVNQIPSEIKLYQNFPNPFNPVTTISFELPTANFITIKVYDLSGKEVTTLVKGQKPAGAFQVRWNASNLPGGIYFYKLKVGNKYIESRKMILLR